MLIQLNKEHGTGMIYRNGVTIKMERSYSGELYPTKVPTQRDGYMRQILSGVLLTFYTPSQYKNFDRKHASFQDMCSFFGITDDDFAKSEDKIVSIDNLDPWMCFTEDYKLVLYFGEDKPQRETKSVKGNTQHRRTWARDLFTNGITYTYWKVKDKSKLFICSCDLFFANCIVNAFPEINLPNRPLEYVDLSQIEPFRASDNYDYSKEEKAAIFAEEKRKEEEKQKYMEELERRKHTDGYCSVCGCEHADYITDPYQYALFGNVVNRWLCHDCYQDLLGDI